MDQGRTMEEVKCSPLISIVLPTYNRAKMLECAVRSIINQKYPNWELIIIDNCSTDDTDSVVSNFNDTRIRLLKIKNGGSIGKSRNHGIRYASGEWIAFIDSDDWWLPNKLNYCLEECNDKVDLIYHDLLISISGKVKKWKKVKGLVLYTPVINDLLVRGNVIANSSVIVRKSLLERVGYISEDMNINPSVDYNTWLRIASVTDAFKYIPKTLGGYLVHAGGVSQRDMSVSTRFAVGEFVHLLTEKQKHKLEANLRYVSGRFNYLASHYYIAKNNFLFVIIHGRLILKIKSLLMISCIFFRYLIIDSK
jgi:glycosyltransferase involved in cell wall biosynthesis